jgi:hypothetical protein
VPAAAKQAPAAAAAAAGGGASDARFAKCGFAKLLGDNGLEYYIKKYEVVMGRRSKVRSRDTVVVGLNSMFRCTDIACCVSPRVGGAT